jgi:phosphoglucosamine mutase
MTKKFFGTDGIRGKVGESLMTPMLALKLGWAAGKVLARHGTHTVLIGKDTRISGYMFESAIEAGLASAGVNIRLLGPMPTPAVAYLTHTFRAEAGIVISASHNPFDDNGIKFFGADGRKLDDELELAIEQELEQEMVCVASSHLGKASRVDNAAGRYIEYCKSHFPMRKNLSKMKLVIDSAHGATYHIAANVFHELGAEVISIGAEPNGFNINDGCGATDMHHICAAVVEHQADLGIALDGDGDRVQMVDATGAIIDGDAILYILALDAYLSGELSGGVVGTLMSNQGLEMALQRLQIPFVRTQVGDRYVAEKMRALGWHIGGESSGHILHAEHGTTGDGIVAAVLVLAALERHQTSLSEMLAEYQKLPQTLINVEFANPALLEEPSFLAQVKQVEQRLASISGRLLLRRSGTQPVVRIMVESPDLDQNTSAANEVKQILIEAARVFEV